MTFAAIAAIRDARIEPHGELFLVSNPAIGALSAMANGDLVAFHLFGESGGALEPMVAFYQSLGMDEDEAAGAADAFRTRLIKDGWTRAAYPDVHKPPLTAVYMTVTRECNLACPYCYQGLSARRTKTMEMDRLRDVFAQIAAIRPDCHIILTGGEPLLHPDIGAILDLIDEYGFLLTVLTNGVLIDEAMAGRLARIRHLECVQVSVDGMTEETFALSRGRGTMAKVRAGLDHVIAAKLPFMVAPTLHRANLHEIAEMAVFAVENGGYIKPNNLRHFPHDSNKAKTSDGTEMTARLVLSEEELIQAARDLDAGLIARFGTERIRALKDRFLVRANCAVDDHNAKSVCGFGWSLLDIDWNGDVYPCHLAKAPELKLGNLFEQSLTDILGVAESTGVRRKSHEIDRCSGCSFVSRCAGGCRVGAYFAYGTFEREDDLCHYNYRGSLERTLASLIPSGADPR